MSQHVQNNEADIWPIGKKSAYFTLFIAVGLALFDFIDRQVLAALFPYIKAEFSLTDTQLGFLVSIVNISIAVLVIPSAYLIDRWSRKKMICVMGVIWSTATLGCAFANSFSHMLVARFLVGAGEAGYNPAAQSLLSASFPRRLRATAISILQGSMGIGAPLGLIIGGYVAANWGWRHALGVVAVPGIALSLLALLIKDFKNKDDSISTTDNPQNDKAPNEASKSGAANLPPCTRQSYLAEMLSILSKPTLLCVFLAQSLMLLYVAAIMNWLPSYFIRAAEMSAPKASSIAAICMMAGSAAMFAAGPLFDWLRRYGQSLPAKWQVFSCSAGFGLLLFAYIFATPGSSAQVASIVASQLFLGTLTVMGFAITNDLSLSHQRATAIGLLVTVQNIFGMMIGPVLTGLLSDAFDLSSSLMIMASLTLLSGLLYAIVAYTYPKDLAKMPTEEVCFG